VEVGGGKERRRRCWETRVLTGEGSVWLARARQACEPFVGWALPRVMVRKLLAHYKRDCVYLNFSKGLL
jgi:hypothetical protein